MDVIVLAYSLLKILTIRLRRGIHKFKSEEQLLQLSLPVNFKWIIQRENGVGLLNPNCCFIY